MSRGAGALDAIHAVATLSPERALLAAVIRLAVEDATAGDGEARQWLASEACARWLAWLVPDGVDAAGVQQRILAALPDDAAVAVGVPARRAPAVARPSNARGRRPGAHAGTTAAALAGGRAACDTGPVCDRPAPGAAAAADTRARPGDGQPAGRRGIMGGTTGYIGGPDR